MKQLLLICAVVMGQSVLAADKKPLTKEESAKVIEAEIRRQLFKRKGELTKADYERLTELNLVGRDLTDVKGLEKLTKLEKLYLSGNQLTSVKGLEKLTQLRLLHLRQNKLAKLPEGLEKLTQLTYLQLGSNQLTNVKGLEKLTQLKTLLLSFQGIGHVNKLTNLKGLEKLTQLTFLQLKGNRYITKAQIAQLQKALPKCNIDSNHPK